MAGSPEGPLRQRRVGVVASYDFDRDRELWRWAPEDVSLVIARTAPVAAADPLTMSSSLARPEHLARPTREVCAAGAEIVAFACTGCSFVAGLAGERALRRTMLDVGAPAALTTAEAALEALEALRVCRVAVVHPFPPQVAVRLRLFLTEAGLEVPTCVGRPLTAAQASGLTYDEVAEMMRAADTREADALFVSCTAVPTYDLITPMEEELGKPVVTANQATVWAALRAIGARAAGPGQRLLKA